MSEILFSIIKDKVYEDKRIQEVSRNSRGKADRWIFNFKGQGLSKVFLREYAKCFWDVFENKGEKRIQIGGMEAGALPLITGVTLFAPDEASVAGFYIRKSRKKNDLANLMEGELSPNVPIVLVDDIIKSGGTMRKQIKILEDLGHRVSLIFVCLRFMDMAAYQDLLDKGIKIVSIFELNDFKDVLPVSNLVAEQPALHQEKYRIDYRAALTDKPNLYVVVPKSAPLLFGEHLYMGVDGGTFYCLKAENGATVWKYKILFGEEGKRIFSSPAAYEDKVLFGAYDGNFYCLNRMTGKRVWVFTDADWIGSSPCIDAKHGTVFVGLEFGLFKRHGGVVAIDIRTGNVKWKNYTMVGLTHASTAYSEKNNLVVCGCNDNYLYAFNAKTGEVIWKYETQAEVKYGAAFDEERGLVIFGSLDGGLYALRSRDGTLYHKFEAQDGFYSTPLLQGHLAVIGSLDKIVYCFNLDTKETEWTFETQGRIFASPAFDKGSVFIGSNDGRLFELDLLTGKALSAIQLTERIVNKIQIGHTSDGKRILYIPTHIGELYRMREKGTSRNF